MEGKGIFNAGPEEQVTDGFFMALANPTELQSKLLTVLVEDLIQDYEMDEESVERCRKEANRQYDLYMKGSDEGSEFRAKLMYRMMSVEKYLDDNEDEG